MFYLAEQDSVAWHHPQPRKGSRERQEEQEVAGEEGQGREEELLVRVTYISKEYVAIHEFVFNYKLGSNFDFGFNFEYDCNCGRFYVSHSQTNIKYKLSKLPFQFTLKHKDHRTLL